MHARRSALLLLGLLLYSVLGGCGDLDPSDNGSASYVKHSATHAPLPERRNVVVMVDVTRSMITDGAVAAQDAVAVKVFQVIDALGPGDWITVVRVDGEFAPIQDVLVMALAPLPAEALIPADNYDTWLTNQGIIDATRKSAEGRKARFRKDVGLLLQTRKNEPATTDLWAGLEYVASQCHQEAEQLLFIASDLRQCGKGVSTQMPPSSEMDFRDFSVKALFVPDIWNDDGKEIKQAWIDFFKQSGARYADVVEAGQSIHIETLLQTSQVPKVAPNSFIE